MNADTFCEHFATFAEAPNGVAKLRELILQLAVQGKLVPQDENDEPASSVLASVKTERERRSCAKEIPSQKPVPPIRPDERLFDLPKEWTWARFGDLCLFIEAGWSPKCEERPRIGNEWGVIKISAVTWGIFDPDENKALPSNLDPRRECEIRPGDFLMTRANTAELVAKSVVVETTPPRLLLNDKTLRVLFPESVSRRYVNLFNNGPIARQHYIRVASGTSESMRNVSRENVLEMPIPLPPLAEQRRIVEKVDQLLGVCDELASRQESRRAARQRLVVATLDRLTSPVHDENGDREGEAPAEPRSTTDVRLAHTVRQEPRPPLRGPRRAAADPASHAKRLQDHFDILFDTPTTIPHLRQAILQLAVQGQLVPQDPNDEPARNLSMEELVGRDNMKNGLSVKQAATACEFYCVPISSMRGGLVDCSNAKPIALTEAEARPFLIRRGDLFVVRGNGSKELVGRAGLVCSDPTNVIFPDLFIRLTLDTSRVSPDYFLVAWNSPPLRKRIEFIAKTTSGIWKINQGHIASLGIPVPPLAEQKRIVSKVAELLSLCDALESQLQSTESASTQLLSAAVSHLLNGQPKPVE